MREPRAAPGARGGAAPARARRPPCPEDDAYRALLAKHESDAGRAFERLNLEKTVAALEETRDEHVARKDLYGA